MSMYTAKMVDVMAFPCISRNLHNSFFTYRPNFTPFSALVIASSGVKSSIRH